MRAHDVWVHYVCINCGRSNVVNLGNKILTPIEAYNNCTWVCEHCGFVHSKDSDLPSQWSDRWDDELLPNDSPANKNFWKGFFLVSTEAPEAYWKRCNVCGRVLPNSAFSKHTGFGILAKQMECRACKGAINAIGNPKRTSEQLREGTLRRRLGNLLEALDKDAEYKLDIKDLFKRFDSKCFMTGEPLDINNRSSWHIDHILPSKYFYPLTKENACLLSSRSNENKKAKWPSEVYSPQQLVRLSEITGANLELLSSKDPIYNEEIDVNGAVEKWLISRTTSDLSKKIRDLKKILIDNNLIDKLSEENKKRLGINS